MTILWMSPHKEDLLYWEGHRSILHSSFLMANSSSLTTATESITIYEKTYYLPVLNSPGFSQLQEQIKQRQQLIKAEKRRKLEQRRVKREVEKSGFLNSLLGKTEIVWETEQVTIEEAMTFEERFMELQVLIKEYNEIIAFLNQHKEAYQLFFVELNDELKGMVGKQCSNLATFEQKRLERMAKAADDPTLVEFYQQQQQETFKNAFILHRAAQLMLKKVELINRSIQKLADDQVQQKDLLHC